jgi:putative transposase
LPEYRRIKRAGGTYFFTVATHGRRPILINPEVRQALRKGINQVRQTMPLTIEAWVLLPDHLHTIWTLPKGDANYQARWAIIKRAVTKRFLRPVSDESLINVVRKTHPTFTGNKISASRQKRQEGGFWQRRFWEHVIRDEDDFQRHMDYLHFNPVKHGYVKNVADWPYSTFHSLVRRNLYPANWGGNGCEDLRAEDFGE